MPAGLLTEMFFFTPILWCQIDVVSHFVKSSHGYGCGLNVIYYCSAC